MARRAPVRFPVRYALNGYARMSGRGERSARENARPGVTGTGCARAVSWVPVYAFARMPGAGWRVIEHAMDAFTACASIRSARASQDTLGINAIGNARAAWICRALVAGIARGPVSACA